MENTSPKRFYIDCTHTYFDRLNDGISRVTRNLIKHADVLREMGCYEIHPIVFHRDKYYIQPSCDIFKDDPPRKWKVMHEPSKILPWCWTKFLSIVSISKTKREACRQRLNAYIADGFDKLEAIFPNPVKPLEASHLSKSDFLIIPELLEENQLAHVGELKEKASMVFIVHDLIPLTHPEYCIVITPHNRFFKFAAKYADTVVAVSQYSAMCFEVYEQLLKGSGESLSNKKIAYFHLGCDLDLDNCDLEPTSTITDIYKGNIPTFLVCGTIEPRKNHLLVLKVFNKLWEQGRNVKLLFIGRYGWKSEQTLQTMTQHPELNKRLFWIPKCSEVDLNYAYENCHALIFASQVEGFGLPLVEALAKGKEVFFSRIKAFQEIVPEEFLINSFDIGKPEELLNLIVESFGIKNRLKIALFKPISWRQSSREFYQILTAD